MSCHTDKLMWRPWKETPITDGNAESDICRMHLQKTNWLKGMSAHTEKEERPLHQSLGMSRIDGEMGRDQGSHLHELTRDS